MKNQKIAFYGITGALSLTLSFFENVTLPQIPFLPPGAKLGLSNAAVMYMAKSEGFRGGLYIVLLKAAFTFITRGVTAGAMSLCGGLLSLAAACLMLKKEGKAFSFIGIGIASAASHNMGQLICSIVITGTPALLNYGKYLLLFSLVTGFITGTVLYVLIPRLEKIKVNI